MELVPQFVDPDFVSLYYLNDVYPGCASAPNCPLITSLEEPPTLAPLLRKWPRLQTHSAPALRSSLTHLASP